MRLVVLLAPLLLVACPQQEPDGPSGPLDADSDGLSDEEEAALGTDPDAADSDGDGLDDADEVELGTNPLFEYSVPLAEGGYVLGKCPIVPNEDAGSTGQGSYGGSTWDAYQVGDTVLNWGGLDAYGQEVGMYNFCGNYTMVNVGAVWCGPCNDLAAFLAEEAEQLAGEIENFTYFELLSEDGVGDRPTVDVLDTWEEDYALYGIPVVGPADRSGTAQLTAWDADGYIPSTILLSPDMRVISMDDSITTQRAILHAIEEWEAAQ